MQIKVKKGPSEERAFAQSRNEYLQRLVPDGTFDVVIEAQIQRSPRIFGSRFGDDFKKIGGQLKTKSHLVTKHYTDEGAASIDP